MFLGHLGRFERIAVLDPLPGIFQRTASCRKSNTGLTHAHPQGTSHLEFDRQPPSSTSVSSTNSYHAGRVSLQLHSFYLRAPLGTSRYRLTRRPLNGVCPIPSCVSSLDFTKMSQTKYLYMAQCVDSLRDLVNDEVRVLKKNKYLANADWTFIEKNFRIDNPHATQSRTCDVAERIAIRESTRRCSECQRTLPVEWSLEQYNEMAQEGRIRTLSIQKVRIQVNGHWDLFAALLDQLLAAA
jgi:hypothetical protein